MGEELPRGWELAKLSEVTQKTYNVNPKKEYEDEFTYIDISSIDSEKLEVIDPKFIHIDNSPSRARQFIKTGDTLVSTVRPNLKRIARVTSKYNGQIASTGFTVLRPTNSLNPDFLFYSVIKNDFTESLITLQRGASYPAVRNSDVFSQIISIPPLPEQKRIVNKLNALFGHLDTLKTKLDRIPELLKNFCQQVLTQAVTGKLTEDWREGKELMNWKDEVDRIISIREEHYNQAIADAKKSKSSKPRKPEYLNYSIDEIDPHEINGWLKAPIGIVCDSIVPGRDKPKNFTGDIPWITMPIIDKNRISSNDAELYLSIEEVEEVKAKIIPKGSVIMSIVGRFGIAAILDCEAVINQQLHAFLPSDLILPEFLMYQIHTSEKYMNEISTSTTVAYINKTKANAIPVAIPPIKEQLEIVRRVEELFDIADNIESQCQSLKEKIDDLPQAILHKAFKGELVPQNADDEPASKLLRGIQNEKGGKKK